MTRRFAGGEPSAMIRLFSISADRLPRGPAGAGYDGVPVGLKAVRAGIERHLAVGDHGVVVGRGDHGKIDRKGDDRDADQQNQMATNFQSGDVRSWGFSNELSST